MHALTVAQVLVLLTLANGAPVIAKLILRDRFSLPLDGNRTFIDGKPLFGASKTIRGVLVAIVVTTAGAPLIGLPLGIGLLVGVTAMAGDLISSFCKRRLGLASSSRATGLDQIPESLLPLLACRQALALSVVDIAVACGLFFVGEILLSRLLFRLHLRERPY
jgi:CDP-diglyceride synthetase